MRSLIRIVVAGGLAAAVLALASVALAAFSAPIRISAKDAISPAVAVGENGSGIVAWSRFDGNVDRIQARIVSATGGFGPVLTLSAPGSSAFTPDVAVDADGDAVVVWTRLQGNAIAQARRISAAGDLGPVVDLSPVGEDASAPRVAVDADGDAIALWFRANVGNQRVLARAIPSSGPLGPVLNISEADAGGTQPRIGVARSGEGYAVWVGSDGENSRAQGRSIDTAGTRGPVRNLSPPGADAGFARVDVDDSGNAFAVWTRPVGADTRVQGRPVPASGPAGTVTTLSASGGNAVLPAISIGSGNGVAVWARPDGVAPLRIEAVAVSPLGGTGSVTPLSTPGGSASNPQVAVDDSGNAQVAWLRNDGTHQRVQERPFSPFGTPQPIRTLSAGGRDAGAPLIAFDPGGDDAVAVWTRPDGAGDQRVEASTGP